MGTLDELIHYCRKEDPIGSLILIGESGCGKTYPASAARTCRS